MRDTRYEIRDTKIRAILFDLGETILNFGKVKANELFHQGAKLSYDFLQSLGQPTGKFKSYCRRNLFAIRLNYWFSWLTGKDFNAMKLLKRINTKAGIELNESQWRHLIWLWYEPLGRFAQVETDIIETLTMLKDKSLKLGILSNTFINGSALEKQLSQFGILDFFDVRLYSYQFNWRKPNVRIFKAAAEKIGENPESIMFVGDRINKDICPAIKAGMTAVLKQAFTNNGKRIPVGAYKVEKISELPELIAHINRYPAER